MSGRAIIIRDKRKKKPYLVRYYGDYDAATDSRARRSKSFAKKRDAERFRAKMQRAADRGAPLDPPTDPTLGEFSDLYLERRAHEWRATTKAHVMVLIARLIAYFGRARKLSTITPAHAAAFWSSSTCIREERKGGELSRSTRNRILRDAKCMFGYARAWRYVAENPFAELKQLHVSRRNRQDWRYMTPAEYRALLKAAPTLRWKVFYALAYTTAARTGELFNLTPVNVALERGRLLIRNREGTEEMPEFRIKDHEDREIPLPRHVVRLVVGWLRVRPSGSPLLLLTPERYRIVLARWRRCRATGAPWISTYLTNNLNRDIRTHAKLAGLKETERLHAHCFRKSCVTNWASELPMHVAKELAGHANITTTAEYYNRVCPEHEERAQRVGERLLGRPCR